MKRHFLRFGFVAVMMCVVFAGCKKTDVASSPADPQLTFAVVPDNPTVTFTAAAVAKQTFTWTSGTANITRFRLNAMRGGIASEYSSAPLSNVDLFSPANLFSTISIPKGDYMTVRAAIVFTQTTGAPFPLVLSGTYTNAGGTAYPVELDFNDNLEININVSNIIADGSKDFTANIAMHLNMLLAGITPADMDAAKVSATGTIIIGKTINPTLYAKVKSNMPVCSIAKLTNKAK